MMQAKNLDRRITILRQGLTNDSYGDAAEAFSSLATIWASVLPSPGRERLASAEAAASATTVFRIRWSQEVATVNPKDRIEYPVGSGRTFDIASVVEIGRREGLEIAGIGRTD